MSTIGFLVVNSLIIKSIKLIIKIVNNVHIKVDSNQYSRLPSSKIASPVPKNSAAKIIPIKSILFHKYSFSSKSANLYTPIPTKNEKGIRFYLKWGFNSSYENYINIFGKRGKIKVNFIFSKSVQQNAKIEILKKNTEIVNIETANQINLAFNDIFFKKKFKKKMKFSSQILQVIEKIKN